MQKKVNKIIEIPCEEDESAKEYIISRIRDYLVDNQDYMNGNILIKSDRFEAVDVVIFEGCGDVTELTKILTF